MRSEGRPSIVIAPAVARKLLVTADIDVKYDNLDDVLDASGKTSAVVSLGKEKDLLEVQAFVISVEVEEAD